MVGNVSRLSFLVAIRMVVEWCRNIVALPTCGDAFARRAQKLFDAPNKSERQVLSTGNITYPQVGTPHPVARPSGSQSGRAFSWIFHVRHHAVVADVHRLKAICPPAGQAAGQNTVDVLYLLMSMV